MRRDNLRIQDMLKAIEAINSFVSGIEYTDLEKDFMRKSAVMAQLTILGEAAKSLSEEFQLQYKGIEWHKVSAMRNFLVHEYFGVEWKIVWDTIQLDLPKLKVRLEELARETETPADSL